MTLERDERNTSTLGMWIFLASELLLFSTVLFSIALYRHLHPSEFGEGSRHLSRVSGALNTAILLTSSWTMAMTVHRAFKKEPDRSIHRNLFWTGFLGLIFLLIKGKEYYDHYQEGLVPALHWLSSNSSPTYQLFFFLYFFSTLLHALHLIIGCVLVSWLWRKTRDMKSIPSLRPWIENIGLYWHFVDLVWIFLFPLLYLIGRNS